MEKVPEVPKSSVSMSICCKVTQLRNELAAVIDQQPNRMTGLHTEDNQLKAALTAMDDAIAKLQTCNKICPDLVPLPKHEPSNSAILSLFERAAMFQNWDRKRKSQELSRPSLQQQKAAKSQPRCGVSLAKSLSSNEKRWAAVPNWLSGKHQPSHKTDETSALTIQQHFKGGRLNWNNSPLHCETKLTTYGITLEPDVG